MRVLTLLDFAQRAEKDVLSREPKDGPNTGGEDT